MKRLFSTLLIFAVLFCCCGSAFAATESVDRSSNLLTRYSASTITGDRTGEVKITYKAKAIQRSSPIGVSSIVIYKSDKSYVTTIKGSTSNGLMATNVASKEGTYVYKGTSGTSYYAVVTLSATADGETENKIVTTGTARAK